MMIAIPRCRVSDYDVRLRSLASLTVVVFVWASMLLVALGLVYRYGTRTLPQNDEVWALYDSGSGIHINWLWKTWAEHRIPLAKLIWKAVLQSTNYDFRAGNFLTILGLAATVGLMLWTANKIRGRTILADAFFPLAILNVGQPKSSCGGGKSIMCLPPSSRWFCFRSWLYARRSCGWRTWAGSGPR